MDLQLPPLATYAYNHGGRVKLTQQRKMAFLLCLMLSLVVVRLIFPVGLLALLLPAWVYLSGERTLKVGARYLICGERIVYFANVKRVSRDDASGRLTLKTGLTTELVIERRRFKKRSSRVADFEAVVADVFAKVGALNPDALKEEPAEEAEIAA